MERLKKSLEAKKRGLARKLLTVTPSIKYRQQSKPSESGRENGEDKEREGGRESLIRTQCFSMLRLK
jgi:hypothetical protein